MNRRVESNHALVHAVEVANQRKLPLLVYEGLTCTYPFANDRLHTFILEGVTDTAASLKKIGAGYLFHLRAHRDDADDALYRAAKKAACVITDDYPSFIGREFLESVPCKIGIPFHAVDSSCVVPVSCFEKREYAAYTIRPKIKRLIPNYLHPVTLPKLTRKWEGALPGDHTEVTASNIPDLVKSCDIDHRVAPSISYTGGAKQAQKHLRHFLQQNLCRYARDRNEPSKHATSDLSPYLHFGHISALNVALSARAHADEHKLIADEFLEELIVRRELAFNYARFTKKQDSLSNLPEWVLKTLRAHAKDKRPVVYSKQQLENAETYDDLWNATQKELLLRGKIHGYYRMYWGKKIIEWSRTAQDALEAMVEFHDRYALDGRDPNTYTNILWCFGLHDRPWGERPIFGMVRYMSLEGMKRKTDVAAYIDEIASLEKTGKDPFRLQ